MYFVSIPSASRIDGTKGLRLAGRKLWRTFGGKACAGRMALRASAAMRGKGPSRSMEEKEMRIGATK